MRTVIEIDSEEPDGVKAPAGAGAARLPGGGGGDDAEGAEATGKDALAFVGMDDRGSRGAEMSGSTEPFCEEAPGDDAPAPAKPPCVEAPGFMAPVITDPEGLELGCADALAVTGSECVETTGEGALSLFARSSAPIA